MSTHIGNGAGSSTRTEDFITCQLAETRLAASLIVDPTARAQAWANVDKMLVNEAAAIPEDFDNQPSIEAKNVAGVDDLWDEGEWDFDFTSLK